MTAQQTRDIEPLLFQCWSTVYDAGPTLNQQWLNASCLLGVDSGGGGGQYPGDRIYPCYKLTWRRPSTLSQLRISTAAKTQNIVTTHSSSIHSYDVLVSQAITSTQRVVDMCKALTTTHEKHRPNSGLTLGQHFQRWPNINLGLSRRHLLN